MSQTTSSGTFKGRPAVPGSVEGLAEVSHIGFNTCATYVDVLISGSDSGVCQDHDNQDLFGHDLADKIVCIPQTIGSSSAATLFMIILEKGIAPKAMLFANHIDSLAACGILMGDNWLGKRIVTVDMLGDEFLDSVKTGQTVRVHEDGTVEIDL
jgi:predicted aconitase with swiveling domain